jgi:helicase
MGNLTFPLYERAERMGILDGGNALIVAPTATGKSHIGREVLRRAIARGESGTHAYLVPFRALAAEIYDAFLDLFQPTRVRVRIVTGDHRDPVAPEAADLVVATYESFTGLLVRTRFRPGFVVADEVHLLADDDRGPAVEGLFARLLDRVRGICALSAVIENGEELARWLGLPFLQGTIEDRPVPLSLECRWADDLDEELLEVLEPCARGEQALVFCSSRPGSEKTAHRVADLVRGSIPAADRDVLKRIADAVVEEDPTAGSLAELLPSGVAYHHAGLAKPIRRRVESAYRERRLRIVTATPTLAAGVNLPAGIVVVRDVFRFDRIRGFGRRVLLPGGEVLNMLGRAARPHQVSHGRGIALVEKETRETHRVEPLAVAIERGRGERVRSRLPESFEAIMRFALSTIVERGEATREDVVHAFQKTFAYHLEPSPIQLDRSFEEDMMEDLPAYKKAVESDAAMRLERRSLSPEGVRAVVASVGKAGSHDYTVTIGLRGVTCSCPASRFKPQEVCKHRAFAIHELLFGRGIEPEIRDRTIYNCGQIFGRSLDLGTRLGQALGLLSSWGLIERVAGAWRGTPLGEVAAAVGFDLLLVHQATGRIAEAQSANYRDVVRWAVEDFLAEENDRVRWLQSVKQWLGEVDEKKIRLPTRYRGDFERGVEDLSRVCLLYEKAALALGKRQVAAAAREAAGAVRYGVAPEVVPLMALGLPQLGRARARYLYDRGIRNVVDLAGADPAGIADPRRAPATLVAAWVERAREIHEARSVSTADGQEATAEFDELVSRFRLDPAALS